MDQQDRLAAVAPVRRDVDKGQPQAVGIEELDHARRCFPFSALADEGAAAITRPAEPAPARGFSRGARIGSDLAGGDGSALIALELGPWSAAP